MRYANKLAVLLVVAGLISALANFSLGQEDFTKVIADLNRQKTLLKQQISNVPWSAGRFDSNDQRAKLMEYYATSLRLMHMPGFEPDMANERGKIINDLRAMGNTTSRDAHTAVVQYLMTELPKLVTDDKQRAVIRYNAMLLLGELNSQEAPRVGVGKATPLAAAFPLLMQAYTDQQQAVAVKVAALIGLHRHASLGIADKAARDALRAEMLKLLAQKQPDKNASEEAHDWLRMRAAEALGALGATGTTPENTTVLSALLGLINDNAVDLALRAEAARAMQGMNFSTPPNINTPLVAQALAGLVKDVIAAAPDRPLLKHVLNCARLGLTGPEPDPLGRTTTNPAAVAKVGTPEAKAMCAALAKVLDDLNRKIDRTDGAALATDITSEAIDAWLQQFPVQNTQLTASR